MSDVSYIDAKFEYDEGLFIYLAKKLLSNIDETDAYKYGTIDSIGNQLVDVNETNEWTLTNLDRLALIMRSALGNDAINEMFGTYSYIKDIDSLFIIKRGIYNNWNNIKKTFDKIISIVYSRKYLAFGEYHNDDYIEKNDESYTDMLSKSFTILSFMIESIRMKKLTSIDEFNKIILNTENTFNITADSEYESIYNFCKDIKFIVNGEININYMSMLKICANILVKGNILSREQSSYNQSRIWEKIQ